MRKILFSFIISLFLLFSVCSAETSKIIYEEDSPISIVYSVHETTASPFGRLGKNFSKHIDKNNNAYYWIRLALGGENYLYYQIKLIIDGTEYILNEEKNPQRYQIASTSRMIMFCKREGAKNYYIVPQEVINKLQNAHTVTMIYRTQDSTEKEKKWNNGMILKVKKIIKAKYDDKTQYKQG